MNKQDEENIDKIKQLLISIKDKCEKSEYLIRDMDFVLNQREFLKGILRVIQKDVYQLENIASGLPGN